MTSGLFSAILGTPFPLPSCIASICLLFFTYPCRSSPLPFFLSVLIYDYSFRLNFGRIDLFSPEGLQVFCPPLLYFFGERRLFFPRSFIPLIYPVVMIKNPPGEPYPFFPTYSGQPPFSSPFPTPQETRLADIARGSIRTPLLSACVRRTEEFEILFSSPASQRFDLARNPPPVLLSYRNAARRISCGPCCRILPVPLGRKQCRRTRS